MNTGRKVSLTAGVNTRVPTQLPVQQQTWTSMSRGSEDIQVNMACCPSLKCLSQVGKKRPQHLITKV